MPQNAVCSASVMPFQKQGMPQPLPTPPLLLSRSLRLSQWLFVLITLFFIQIASSAAHAQITGNSPPPSNTEPVHIEADRMAYDSQRKIAVAEGHVKVTQLGRYILADTLIYNQQTGIVNARGHVEMHEPDGSVYHAEEVELKDDLQQGVIERLKAEFMDNSTLRAEKATRTDGSTSTFTDAGYTACTICTHPLSDKEEDPLWELKAAEVTYDEKEQEVSYKHARMEVKGVPVLYVPYFSHPSPNADSKSGLLVPTYEVSTLLGTVVEAPVYWSIAPDKEAILTPVYTSQEGPLMKGEYSQLTETGRYKLGGSITYPERRNNLGEVVDGQEIRGHVSALGNFHLDPTWQWGFDVNRASDDTYLRRYDIMNVDSLNSRMFLEGVGQGRYDRTYAMLEGMTFQDLRLDLQNQPAVDTRTPFILPEAYFAHETDPMWMDSRFQHAFAMRSLNRSGSTNSHLAHFKSAWEVPYTTPNGHVFGFTASLRGDAYSIGDFQPTPAYGGETEYQTRLIPESILSWRYPLLRRNDHSTLLVEPRVELAASPAGNNPDIIPNEDSQVEEFSAANLFEPNRYSGYDRVETGPRANYGVSSTLMLDEGYEYTAFLGQSYHWTHDFGQMFSANPNTSYSDYVGMLGAAHDLMDIAYRFRVDADNLEVKRNEINGWLKLDPIYFMAEFTQLVDDPNLNDREEIFAGLTYLLDEQWSLTAGGRRNLLSDSMINARANLMYQNECLRVITAIDRQFTRDRDIEPNTSYTLQLQLRNLN